MKEKLKIVSKMKMDLSKIYIKSQILMVELKKC